MKENEKRELLQDIQDDLEKLKDEGVDILFLASLNNRGVITGDMNGIMAMLMFNMMRYPQMKFIMEKVVELYPVYAPQMQLEVMAGQPAHEVVDNYGMDVERMMSKEHYAKNARHWSLFTFNYPPNWIEAVWKDSDKMFHEHLKRNFEKYDRDMTRFMLELDKNNREKLLYWVFENFKG